MAHLTRVESPGAARRLGLTSAGKAEVLTVSLLDTRARNRIRTCMRAHIHTHQGDRCTHTRRRTDPLQKHMRLAPFSR